MAGLLPLLVMGGWPVRTVGLCSCALAETPTAFQVDIGMVVTSLTTWAGAEVVGVKEVSWLLPVAFTMKRAAMTTITSATPPQARRTPLREFDGPLVGPPAALPGRAVLPPLPPPPATGRLAARLLSLALCPPLAVGFGVLPPVTGFCFLSAMVPRSSLRANVGWSVTCPAVSLGSVPGRDVVHESGGCAARCLRWSLIHISEPTRQAEISYAVF